MPCFYMCIPCFIMYVFYEKCFVRNDEINKLQLNWPRCPGTCRFQRAVAPCIIRPSAPMILIRKNKHVLVLCEKSFNYNGLFILHI